MAVTSRKNQYRGINAHLNSLLQQENGDWETFHSHHIGDIQINLNEHLRGTGYIAKLEKGVQIRREGLPPLKPEADILIEAVKPARFSSPPAVLHPSEHYKVMDAVAAIILPNPDEDTELYRAVRIYHRENEMPVAWIELLSPSNKRGGRHYEYYLERRYRLLETESCSYIEIDYLHQSSPVVHGIPDYARKQMNATPYRVSLIDTRPGIESGKAYIIESGIDEPIPGVIIPLLDKDSVELDLQAAYQSTYYRAGYGINDDTRVDYAKLPPDFESYSPEDRKKIVLRMLAVLDAAQQGMDLEAGNDPLPIDETYLMAQAKNLLPELDFAFLK